MPSPTAPHHLLIPFAGHDAPGCRAALASLRLPNLESLLARLVEVALDEAPADSYSPPHERALADALGLAAPDGRIPWAAWQAATAGLGKPGDAWAWLTLCHWEVAIDEVVLDVIEEGAGIPITEGESQALMQAARPLFEEDGIALHAGPSPGQWLAAGELFRDLPTASIDRVAGQPISAWARPDAAMRPLRKLQNEMQMLLYTERVNDQRIARGAPAINSFWVSGTGALPVDADRRAASAGEPAGPAAPPVVDPRLRLSALRDDGAGWARAWLALDAGPCADLLAACHAGEPVALTLCGDRQSRRYAARPRGVGRWLKALFQRPRADAVLGAL
ncbi:MAG: hypothetical protein EOO24_06690 [Comamonadaceae bacterium]|nr:MAG: hypothetical protein EOO24_06690 [Comamonadaceae bacterium]